jgi:peptidoglycan/LPS O-acetylase OafA/YrhL
MEKQKIYFPNLNGLRFIAAFLVIIHHIEQFKSIYGLNNYWEKLPFINIIGKLGVILFFVLSGFLITYLLLAEEQVQKKISIKSFYIRRILRIWPLYFFILILAFAVLPNIPVFVLPGYNAETVYLNLIFKLILFVFFLPNLVMPVFGIVPYASHLWSIGIEEQFYLAWPLVLKFIRKRRIILMLSIIFFYLLISRLLNSVLTDFLPHKEALKEIWYAFNIDCMAIGGLFAILLIRKNKILSILMNKYVFYSTLILCLTMLIQGVYIPYIHYEIYALLFGVLILNFAANPEIKLSLENKTMNYLGKISYGLYMYHPIGIVLSIYLAGLIKVQSNWILYPMGVGFTILLASLSYKYFETGFLNLKKRFSKI